LADEDSDIERRLKLMQAADDPTQFKKVLASALTARGFLDYHRSLGYARRLQPVLTQLESRLASAPVPTRELIEYALKRLLKTYPKADDSAGAIGECVADFARLHAEACHLAPGDKKKLATLLYKLKTTDEWSFFPLEAYWEALDDEGQLKYSQL